MALGAIALTACSEGKYWDEPSSLPADAIGFAKPNDAVTIAADAEFPSSYEISIGRSDANSEFTVPVVQGVVETLSETEKKELGPDKYKVTQDVNGEKKTVTVQAPIIVFTQRSPELSTKVTEVKFRKGEYVAPFVVDIDKSAVEPGYDYDLQLTVCEPRDMNMTVSESNRKLTFTIRQAVILKWESAGTATLTSSIFEDKGEVEVPVEVASNYPNKKFSLYRLVSPYHYLDPENVEEGFNIEFICNVGSVRRANSPVEGWQQTGVKVKNADGIETNVYLGSREDLKSSFKNQKKVYSLVETIGYNIQSHAVNAVPEDPEKIETETLRFKWDF